MKNIIKLWFIILGIITITSCYKLEDIANIKPKIDDPCNLNHKGCGTIIHYNTTECGYTLTLVDKHNDTVDIMVDYHTWYNNDVGDYFCNK